MSELLKERCELTSSSVANLLWSVAKVAAREPFSSLVEPICDRAMLETPGAQKCLAVQQNFIVHIGYWWILRLC